LFVGCQFSPIGTLSDCTDEEWVVIIVGLHVRIVDGAGSISGYRTWATQKGESGISIRRNILSIVDRFLIVPEVVIVIETRLSVVCVISVK
jgi:hypothetical protein